MSENRQLSPAAQKFNEQLDAQAGNFRALLPSHIPVERFKRTVVVAVSQNPELMNADRRTFFNAAQKCAGDGLLPDGREAALVIFNTKMKRPNGDGTYREEWVPAVQYMPMVQGIRKRMRNSGEVLSAEAHVVYRNDKFMQSFGDDGKIIHEPPTLGQDRGEPVGAYAIIKLRTGETVREVMDKNEIERVRTFSRSKDGPAWKNWWGEMAKKTVLRRASKAAPNSAEMETLMSRDEDPPELSSLVELSPPEPEPERGSITGPIHDEPLPSYIVIDADGEEHEYASPEATVAALLVIFRDARRRGRSSLRAALENNNDVARELEQNGPADLVDALRDYTNPLDLPPIPGAAAPAQPPQDAPNATPGQPDLLPPDDGPNPLHVPPPPKGAKREDWLFWERQIGAVLAERPGDSAHRANVKHANDTALRRAKVEDYEVYERVMPALLGREVEAG